MTTHIDLSHRLLAGLIVLPPDTGGTDNEMGAAA